VHCQRLVIVGDAHLGRESAAAERAFLSFLDAVPALGDGLLVTGDLFEFWFTWRRVIPRRSARVVAGLAALRRRLPVLLLGGNHDRWAGDFWQELDIEFAAGEARLTVAGRPALARHGDGLTESHWSASLLHRITRHPATIGLFEALHPDAGIWLVDHLSGVLGDARRAPEHVRAAADRQRAWVEARLARDPEVALIVLGHTHVPEAREVAPRRWYVNPGAWFDGARYAVAESGGVTLHHFNP
jgi:UDP-2,3-diacylglucosamine hydrolase